MKAKPGRRMTNRIMDPMKATKQESPMVKKFGELGRLTDSNAFPRWERNVLYPSWIVNEVHSMFLSEEKHRKLYIHALLDALDEPCYPVPKEKIYYMQNKRKSKDARAASSTAAINRRALFNNIFSPNASVHNKDPAMINNPLGGRLKGFFAINTAIFFVFFTTVAWLTGQHNLYYLSTIFQEDPAYYWFSDSAGNWNKAEQWQEILIIGGALHANIMRATNDYYRMFWSMWMHASWKHVIFNVFVQLTYFHMMEPDWGFWRLAFVYWISGIVGNLTSLCFSPCTSTVGSSGCLYGLLGGSLAYQLEYWYSQPQPLVTFIVTIVVIVISILTSVQDGADNWAHLGGLITGFFAGMMTVSNLPLLGRKHDQVEQLGDDKQREFARYKPIGWQRFYPKNLAARFYHYCFKDYSCLPRIWAVRIISTISISLAVFIFSEVILHDNFLTHKTFGPMTWDGFKTCCCAYYKEGFQCSRCEYFVRQPGTIPAIWLTMEEFTAGCAADEGVDVKDVYSYECPYFYYHLQLNPVNPSDSSDTSSKQKMFSVDDDFPSIEERRMAHIRATPVKW